MNAFFRGTPTDKVCYEMIRLVRTLCETGHSVVIGRGGCVIAADLPKGFHVRIVAPFSWRVEQVASYYEISKEEAERRTRLIDGERKTLFKKRFKREISDPNLYHMVLNQSELEMDCLVDVVVQGVERKKPDREVKNIPAGT